VFLVFKLIDINHGSSFYSTKGWPKIWLSSVNRGFDGVRFRFGFMWESEDVFYLLILYIVALSYCL
jgi:hypothetical protein